MTSPVYCQLTATRTAFATVCALVFSSMKIHMTIQGALRRIIFLTLDALKWFFSSVHSFMSIQISSPCKTFVTNIAPIRPWLVIMSTISGVSAISFNIHFTRLRFINTISFSLKCLVIPCTFTTQQIYKLLKSAEP